MKYKINIEQDEFAESPRESGWSNLGTMVCAHGRYVLGDEQLDTDQFNSWEGVRRDLVKNNAAVVILPLFLYDHSGITMYTEGDGGYRQHEAWDSGQVGYIYATEDDVREEFGDTTPESLAKAELELRHEIKTYDTYLRGEVYQVQVLNGEDVIDSCGGLYGEAQVQEYIKDVSQLMTP